VASQIYLSKTKGGAGPGARQSWRQGRPPYRHLLVFGQKENSGNFFKVFLGHDTSQPPLAAAGSASPCMGEFFHDKGSAALKLTGKSFEKAIRGPKGGTGPPRRLGHLHQIWTGRIIQKIELLEKIFEFFIDKCFTHNYHALVS
jgi:hypothetical protein